MQTTDATTKPIRDFVYDSLSARVKKLEDAAYAQEKELQSVRETLARHIAKEALRK